MRTIDHIKSLLFLSFAALLVTGCETNDANVNSAGNAGPTTGPSLATTSSDELDMTYSASTSLLTPAEERSWMTRDLNRIRAMLTAELAEVRDRLNIGTREEAAKTADEERAADLAQGLERVDRALVAVGAANDITWADIRESQKKEVAEVREWMHAHDLREEAVARVE